MEDLYSKREDKSTSYTLGITLLLMAFLIIVAWALKRNAAGHAKPETPAAEVKPGKPAVPPVGEPSIPLGDDRQPLTEYEIITDCRLLEGIEGNDGDSFGAITPRGSFRFRLYWVQTPQMNGASPEQVRTAMDHFGLKTEASLHELAVEARDFTLNTLKAVHFRIVTRWERDPAEQAYLCFVYASDGDAEKPLLHNLSLLLVQNGLALIRPSTRPLPEMDVSAGDFQNQLITAEDAARQSLLGGWARRGR